MDWTEQSHCAEGSWKDLDEVWVRSVLDRGVVDHCTPLCALRLDMNEPVPLADNRVVPPGINGMRNILKNVLSDLNLDYETRGWTCYCLCTLSRKTSEGSAGWMDSRSGMSHPISGPGESAPASCFQRHCKVCIMLEPGSASDEATNPGKAAASGEATRGEGSVLTFAAAACRRTLSDAGRAIDRAAMPAPPPSVPRAEYSGDMSSSPP